MPDSDRVADCLRYAGKGAMVVDIGPAELYASPPLHRRDVFSIVVPRGNEKELVPLLSLDKSDQGISVNSDLYDSDGNIVARVRDNNVDASGWLSCRRPNLNTLIIKTLWGREMLYVQYRNNHSLTFRGFFRHPEFKSPVQVTTTSIDIGSGINYGPDAFDCIGSSGDQPLLGLGLPNN
jgi:hypothetical protein